MARRPLTIPRKHASQARSRATVDALIAATARILVRESFDRASTNRIAEAAGVSIGSLYHALTHTAVLHHEGLFTDEALATLTDEATRLVVRYLEPAA